MKFYNINNPSEKVSLREAVLKSSPGVYDLYMPERIPVLDKSFIKGLKGISFREIANKVSMAFLEEDLSEKAVEKIVESAFTFDAPLHEIEKDLFSLELFHGPTLAFKDFGARFMALLFEDLLANENREIVILVATSGDTGSAVANAFYNRKGIRVIILYPSGRVSEIQEKQLTTMGGNITTLEVEGTFDDCQRLVKQAFADEELKERISLSSANSINFARLMPQSFYYFYAVAQLEMRKKPVIISVPSGNFGNLTAGLIARQMGLPVDKFIASTNINRSVPDYLDTGNFNPGMTHHTLTNAMDVGNPSNFPRILELFGRDLSDVRSALEGYWFTDEDTLHGMKELYDKFGYMADPHGAVGYLGLKKYKERKDCTGIFLGTAHPVKFPETVMKATGKYPDIPQSVSHIFSLEKRAEKISVSFEWFRDYLLSL